MAADRFSFGKSFDSIQARFVGTGHSDMTKFEWAVNQHRDTIGNTYVMIVYDLCYSCYHKNIASHIGHYDMLSYFAVAQNDSIGRVKYQLYEVGSIC